MLIEIFGNELPKLVAAAISAEDEFLNSWPNPYAVTENDE